MADIISVGFDEKTRRLVVKAPFYLNDVVRSFPSRRFDPKTKAWKVPLTKQNTRHIEDNRHKYDFVLDADATRAIESLDALTQGPVYLPFPREWFEESGNKPPLDHQWQMLDFGWNLESYALIAAMGTGKTFVTINTLMARWKYKGLKRAAIITLKNLGNTWKKEFKKWHKNEDDYTIYRVQSGDHAGLSRWMKEDPYKLHVLLIGVEGLGVSEKYADTVRGFWLQRNGPIQAVVDESSRIKNPNAKRSNVVVDLGKPNSDYRTILNGTPTSKSVGDLFMQYEFLDPNIIGSGDYWAYRTRYLVYGGYEGKQLVGYQNVEELMNLIRPYTLEVDKSVLNLPPKIYKVIDVEPTEMQRAMMKQIIKGKGPFPRIKVQNVLERDLRLQQVAGGFQPVTVNVEHNGEMFERTELVPLEENPKFNHLIDLIESIVDTSKLIIWSRFVPEIEMIVAALEKIYGPEAVVSYYGAVSDEDRAAAEDRYCNDPRTRFFVGNPAAAGLGLTLVSGENDVMVYYSGTFAYIDRTQSEDRAHRIGQKNTCLVVDMVMDRTIDNTIQASIAEKMDLDKFIKKKMNEGRTLDELLEGIV